MTAPPSRGKPQDPRDESQIDPGPIVDAPVFPQMGGVNKRRFMPGKYSGRVIRAGKK